MFAKVKEFFTPVNSLLVIILLIGFVFRVYRIDQLLGFYYDQARDALVIWDLIHKGKLFLIGPTTGIAGIFRGPWYYWLITPFYFLGNGNPVYPSVFLSITTIAGVFLGYKIIKEFAGEVSGLLFAVIGSFSLYLVYASRWLSNPTPMLFISMGVIYSTIQVVKKKEFYWLVLAFLMGMSMQFGSSGEVFYFPALLTIMIWKKIFPKPKTLVWSLVLFFVAFLPQIAFDIKHDGILRNNVYKFIFGEGSFKASFWETFKVRLPFYLDVFGSKIFPQTPLYQKALALFIFATLLTKRKKLFSGVGFPVIFIFWASPLLGMLFFQGNFGNVYDYYFTGYYFIFGILVAALFGQYLNTRLGKLFVMGFMLLFLHDNIPQVRNYIISGVDGPTTVAYGNQKLSVDWIYKTSSGRDFNVDSYVPPVIPHTYDYLFKWYGPQKFGTQPLDKNVELLYTLYEVDPDHPERLDAWLKRQESIGKVVKTEKFGGITVEERKRIKFNQ